MHTLITAMATPSNGYFSLFSKFSNTGVTSCKEFLLLRLGLQVIAPICIKHCTVLFTGGSMKTIKCAQICGQGECLIIVPLDASFENEPPHIQSESIRSLQKYAEESLAGTVVPVWRTEKGIKFKASQKHYSFFKGLTWDWVQDNLNKKFFC